MYSIYSLLFFFLLQLIFIYSFSPLNSLHSTTITTSISHNLPFTSSSSLSISNSLYSKTNKILLNSFHQTISPSLLSSRLYNARQTSSGGGKTDVITKKKKSDKIDVESEEEIIDEIESNYRLVLHDDDLHTIDEVVDIIIECCPLCPPPRAYEVTLQVHMEGMGTVCVANKKIIEEYILALQAAGLSVSMGKDDEFKEGEDNLDDTSSTPST